MGESDDEDVAGRGIQRPLLFGVLYSSGFLLLFSFLFFAFAPVSWLFRRVPALELCTTFENRRAFSVATLGEIEAFEGFKEGLSACRGLEIEEFAGCGTPAEKGSWKNWP